MFLNRFQIIKPKNQFSQSRLNQWISDSHQKADTLKNKNVPDHARIIEKLFTRYGVKESQISQRFFECDDINKKDNEEREIYFISDTSPQGADITQRADFFSKRSFEVFEEIYSKGNLTAQPDHLIHVTCTGYTSPSSAQKLVSVKNWSDKTDVSHAYHMGCYASLPSIRLGASLAAYENKHVDIVHNEMCGLHMNVQVHTPEQIIIQTLFADGHIKYSVTQKKTNDINNFKILNIKEKIVPLSEDDMQWLPSQWGMHMSLSREVPAKIKSQLKEFYEGLIPTDLHERILSNPPIFAIHPGGPKIIQSVQELFNLECSQIEQSKRILYERGNMSSATLPHIWESILKDGYPSGTLVVSFAFGPGLTIFGAIFEVC